MRWLVIAAITARLVAAALLVFGPWTDSATDLTGWDVERFQEIADADGRAWVDHEVEYPPGSVAVIEAVARPTVVGTHRALVVGSLVIDGAVAVALAALGTRRAAAWYLVLGLPLVPMGMLRLDIWSVALAVLAMIALRHRRSSAFAALATLGALVKVWPALLLVPALALGRWRAGLWTAATMLVAGVLWIGWAGWSIDPISQVTSLRGATGWHVESVPGSVVALLSDEDPELQFNAYRIGSLSPALVRVGQALAIGVAVALVVRGKRAMAKLQPVGSGLRDTELAVAATVMVGAVSALLVTAPLLSPQFLLWLTPWAALTATIGDRTLPGARLVVWPVGAAIVLTGGTLAGFGPPNLGAPLPAALLLVRDACLVGAVVLSARALDDEPGPVVAEPTPTPATQSD